MKLWVACSGIAFGMIFGFVLQRSRFSLNTAFREVLYIKNFTLFRAYILALVVAILGSNLLEQFGVIALDDGRQDFAWLANMLGGYLFGIGMVLAGGGSEGTWYQAGEGLVGSWMAALGFMMGTTAAKNGIFSCAYEYLRSFTLFGTKPTLYGLLGMNRWVIILIVILPGIAFLAAGRRTYAGGTSAYQWPLAGGLVGAVIMLGWYVSTIVIGTPIGINLTGTSGDLLVSILADGPWNWGVALLVGIPLGSFISARLLHEFSWRAPRANVVAQQLFGGFVMGVGGMLAGGCSVGHGLTGMSTLSLASLVSTIFILLGSWTMVYLLFMRNPGSD